MELGPCDRVCPLSHETVNMQRKLGQLHVHFGLPGCFSLLKEMVFLFYRKKMRNLQPLRAVSELQLDLVCILTYFYHSSTALNTVIYYSLSLPLCTYRDSMG